MELTPEIDAVLRGERAWGFQAGHCLDSLRALPDGCVSCVVTSPPYYALRDYGTGIWEGGDLACDHKATKRQNMDKLSERYRGGGHSASTAECVATWPGPSCHRCGAVRVDQQIGLEDSPAAYVAKMVEVFREVRRVLHPSGTFWLNIGDSYASKGGTTNRVNSGKQLTNAHSREVERPYAGGVKNLLGVPWRLAFALQEDGWYLRSEITLCKTSPMPESVRDRPTQATEKLFLLTANERYFYDQDAERVAQSSKPHASGTRDGYSEGPMARGGNGWKDAVSAEKVYDYHPDGRNLWNYWEWSSDGGFSEAHFATFPTWLPRRCIRLGSSERGVCPSCYAPWRRIVERSKVKRQRPNDYVKREGQDGTGNSCANTVAGTRSVTKGWEPSCRCGHEPIPALVLDPFSGAGTTVKVAHELGRRAIGLELSESYIAMARRRIANASLVKDESIPADPLPLFAAGF